MGTNILIDESEDVPRDKMAEDGKFYKVENDACAQLCGGRCAIYEKRPFACRAYPFMVVNGELRMDRWCPKIRDLGEAELQKIQEWITENVPPQVSAFWNKQGGIR
jgi:Fe-S-cluster containining protein